MLKPTSVIANFALYMHGKDGDFTLYPVWGEWLVSDHWLLGEDVPEAASHPESTISMPH